MHCSQFAMFFIDNMKMAKSRFIIPKNRKEKLLFLFMTFLIPLTIVWEFGVVLPQYHSQLSFVVAVHAVLAAFIVTNIFGNLLMTMRTDASGRQSFLPSVQKPDWRYCYECKLSSPPRSYHCHQCNECVLKRDHHCMFMGCCIGYHNQRYYLMAISYILLGSFYAVVYQWDYSFSLIGGFSFSTVLSLVAPHLALVLGYLSLYSFLVATVQILGILVVAFSSYLVVTQVVTIANGQTQYERKHDIRLYDLGWKRNVVDVLGSRWAFVWIVPTIESPLLGDGLRFVKTNEYEDVKAI